MAARGVRAALVAGRKRIAALDAAPNTCKAPKSLGPGSLNYHLARSRCVGVGGCFAGGWLLFGGRLRCWTAAGFSGAQLHRGVLVGSSQGPINVLLVLLCHNYTDELAALTGTEQAQSF